MEHVNEGDPGAAEIPGRRIERDPAPVLASIAARTGHDVSVVDAVVAVIRTVVDDLLADGYVVALSEVILSFGDSPTRRALRERLASPEAIPEPVLRLDHDAVADWLGLDWEDYADRPLANRSLIGTEVFELLGDAAPERPVMWGILETWDDSFADGRAYKVGSAGLEAAFERWLIENLDRLAEHGIPVRLAHQQRVLPNRKIPDLLCRFTEDTEYAKAGDWLVIELKSTRYYPAAADQVAGYVDQVAEHLATEDEQVVALLITDGANYSEIETLRQRGIAHLSLAAVGYRRALAQDVAPARASALSVPMASFDDMRSPTDDGLLPTGDTDIDGATVYWVRLFHDVDSSEADEAREQEAAAALWAKREERRQRYEREWGAPNHWPAQHPTTVIKLSAPATLSAAVCIRCDWLARPTDESGEPVDLSSEAKAHALEHPHDSALERGENPKRQRQANPEFAALVAEAREHARRAARRVARREND